MSETVPQEAERLEVLKQIEDVNQQLAEDPGNEVWLELKAELLDFLKAVEEEIKAATTATKKPEKDEGNQPAVGTNADTQKDEQATEPSIVIKYAVNDDVMAKWVSGDKAFYAARITSVTGSASDPVYTVRFRGYDTVETLRSKDIRPVTTAGKRKADAMEGNPLPSPAPLTTAPPPLVAGTSGPVVQKAAEKYPNAAESAKKDDDKPKPKYKKMKPTKELEANKNNWQNFTAKGKFGKSGGLPKKKESMFRVPEGANGRVGFIGSGQTMRKDVTRTRHVYQVADDDN